MTNALARGLNALARAYGSGRNALANLPREVVTPEVQTFLMGLDAVMATPGAIAQGVNATRRVGQAMTGDSPYGAASVMPEYLDTGEVLSPAQAQARRDRALTRDIVDALGLVGGTSALGASAPLRAEKMAFSRDVGYTPPKVSQRVFGEDYDDAALARIPEKDRVPGKRLGVDVEGRPLGDGYVVGRNEVGGGDVPLPAEALDEIAQAATGGGIEYVPQSALGRDLGRVTIDRRSQSPRSVEVTNSPKYTDDQRGRVAQHEIGHVIDEVASQVDSTGIADDLSRIYHVLNDGGQNPSFGAPRRMRTRPEDRGYRGGDVKREMMAEAIRAYMADPNWLKTVSPKTAARIRAAVNENPTLSGVVQFNARPVAPFPTGEREDSRNAIRNYLARRR